MMKQIFALLALFASASAFVPAGTSAAFGVAKSSTTLAMAMQAPEMKKGIIAAVAGAMPAVLASTAAVATDGTGEWFGVDDIRLLGVLFLGHWFILTLYLNEFKDADEEEDFFGEIDYTNGGRK